MMKSALAAIAVAALVTTPAFAKPKRASALSPECNVTMPCLVPITTKNVAVPSFGVPQITPTSIVSNYSYKAGHFIRGRLICAVNVNAELARRGIRGTGSAKARSFLTWGTNAGGPVKGAVAVFSRGGRGNGHVAIVDHVGPDGTVYYLNPSSRRQAWQVAPYHKRPLAFRVASTF